MSAQVVFLLQGVPRERESVAFRPMLGVPLFLRSLFVMAEHGFTRFVCVAPAHARRHIQKTWEKFAAGRNAQLTIVACRPEHRLTRETFAALCKATDPRFFLCDTNTLVTARWVREVLRPALVHDRPLTGPGRLCTHRELAHWQRTLPAEGIPADQVVTPTPAPRPGLYHPIYTVDAIPAGEWFLCEQIRLSATGFIARHLNKRISLPISRPLARLRVAPNVITAVNMFIGLLAGIGTAGRTYVALLIGGALFQLASILDGCDGEVAKLTHRTTKFGQYIDTISDNFALASFFTGLLIHHYRVMDPMTTTVWGGILFSGLIVLFTIIIRFLRHTDSASFVTFEKEYLGRLTQQRNNPVAAFARVGKALLKKDCFSLLFFVAAVVGILPLWLYIVAIGVWGGVLTLVILQIQHASAPLPTHAASSSARQERLDVLP